MALVPSLIKNQGLTITEFIGYTVQTNALGMIAVFTISQTLFDRLRKRGSSYFKNNIEVAISSVLFSVIMGPFVIEWTLGIYDWLNERIGDTLSDAFFRLTTLS